MIERKWKCDGCNREEVTKKDSDTESPKGWWRGLRFGRFGRVKYHVQAIACSVPCIPLAHFSAPTIEEWCKVS